MKEVKKAGFGAILGAAGAIYGLVVLNVVLALVGISGAWAIILAVGIASIQAALVAIFSMELFLSRRSIVVIAIVAPLFVVLLVSLTVADIYTRQPPLLGTPPVYRSLPMPPP